MAGEEIMGGYRGAKGLPVPASGRAVAELEAAVGFPMPLLLKRKYLEVADGEFDSRGEVLPLTDLGYRSPDVGRTVSEVYQWFMARPDGVGHPAWMVPLRFEGCTVWTMVDWRTPEGRMWGYDGGPFRQGFDLAEWLCRDRDGDVNFPRPARGRGRPVELEDWGGPDWLPGSVHGIHDDKTLGDHQYS